MKRSWLVLALLLSVGVNAGILLTLALRRAEAPVATRAPEATRAAEIPEPALRRLVDRLGLEGEDAVEFARVQRELFRGLVENRRRSIEAQARLRRELGAREPDPGRLEALVRRSTELFHERQKLLVEAVLRSRQLLDRDQLQQYRRFLMLMGRQIEGRPIDERGVEARPGEGRRRPPMEGRDRFPGRQRPVPSPVPPADDPP